MRIFIRTSKKGEIKHYINTYSICSVARPRPTRVCKTPTAELFQSTRSQDRDLSVLWGRTCLGYFNPLGRKTETIYRRSAAGGAGISIHSVARPRLLHVQLLLEGCPFQSTRSQDRDTLKTAYLLEIAYFNPLGRKTETFFPGYLQAKNPYFNPLGRKTETAKLNNY